MATTLTPGPTTSARAATPNRVVRVSRLSRGHVLMVVAGLAAAALAFAALRTRPGDVKVAVAAREIRAGARVVAADFRVVSVSLGTAQLAPLVTAAGVHSVVGAISGATIEPGELVPRRWLRPRAARHGLRSISIPIDPARAVGGHLAVGDRVDVLLADDRTVAIIVPDAEVLAVDERGRGGIGDSASPFTVTIAVDEEQSRAVAAAVVGDGLSLARTTGATPATERSAAADGAPSSVPGVGGR
jgi:Flp pilus assembly protein CpaB